MTHSVTTRIFTSLSTMCPAVTRALIVLTSAAYFACSGLPFLTPSPSEVSDSRYAMGTVLEVSLWTRQPAEGRRIIAAIFRRVEELEALFSHFRPESALSTLNRAAGRGPQPVPWELARMLSEAAEYSRLTLGTFDVTVGPLVELWQTAAQRNQLPTPPELTAAYERVGIAHLRVIESVRGKERIALAELAREGMSIDLGGVAKGYALDRARELLLRGKIDSALIDFGQSSWLAIGAPPKEPHGWRVLLRGARGEAAGVLTLRDQMLSVSGSLGQVNEIEGQRFGHIVDPRSGRPITKARQVAVVAQGGTQTEALTKALLVLGADEGIALLEPMRDVEALLLDADGETARTSGWNDAVAFEGFAAQPHTPRGDLSSPDASAR